VNTYGRLGGGSGLGGSLPALERVSIASASSIRTTSDMVRCSALAMARIQPAPVSVMRALIATGRGSWSGSLTLANATLLDVVQTVFTPSARANARS